MTWRGQTVLGPTREGATHAMEMASFPLAPFANRIARGAFIYGDRHVRLSPNYPGEPHPLHGSAWLAKWCVELVSEDAAVLSYSAPRGEWPWRFSCTQTIKLTELGAEFVLAITNEDEEIMPASIGFHPAVPLSATSVLSADVAGVWLCDREKLPTHFTPAPILTNLREGVPLRGAPPIDNCHGGWRDAVRITTGDLEVEISASAALSFLHVYLPPGRAFVCLEPVSAMPDAFNRSHACEHGLMALAPGEMFSVWMRVHALSPPPAGTAIGNAKLA